jgi:hypothetical protein
MGFDVLHHNHFFILDHFHATPIEHDIHFDLSLSNQHYFIVYTYVLHCPHDDEFGNFN